MLHKPPLPAGVFILIGHLASVVLWGSCPHVQLPEKRGGKSQLTARKQLFFSNQRKISIFFLYFLRSWNRKRNRKITAKLARLALTVLVSWHPCQQWRGNINYRFTRENSMCEKTNGGKRRRTHEISCLKWGCACLALPNYILTKHLESQRESWYQRRLLSTTCTSEPFAEVLPPLTSSDRFWSLRNIFETAAGQLLFSRDGGRLASLPKVGVFLTTWQPIGTCNNAPFNINLYFHYYLSMLRSSFLPRGNKFYTLVF